MMPREFASLSGALRAARRFHAAYGMQGARYKARRTRRGFYEVECWQAKANGAGFYLATII